MNSSEKRRRPTRETAPFFFCLTAAVACALGILTGGCIPSTRSGPVGEGLSLAPTDRILILAPHPDDEIIGCGGIIQKAVARNLPLRIVFLTNGDNNQWSFVLYRKRVVLAPSSVRSMGSKRQEEAVAAAQSLGVKSNDLVFLGYPDMGTLTIWNSHWAGHPPYRSMLTRATGVPYANAFRPGAAHKGEEILRDLTAIIRDFRPTRVFVSHPADHNMDHRALYLFARVATWDLEPQLRPTLCPYLVHFKRWPRPHGFYPEDPLRPPAFFDGVVPWSISPLDPAEEAKKESALKKHHTQYMSNSRYLSSFVRKNELFGDFPCVVLAPTSAVTAAVDFSGQAFDEAETPPAELSDDERELFTGIEWRSARIEGGDLVLAVKLSRPLAKAVEASFDVFGYRDDRAFALMPKLHARVNVVGQKLLDQSWEIPSGPWKVERKAREILLRIPTVMLGDPQRVLVSARTYLGDVPLDWVSWRTLSLPGDVHTGRAAKQPPSS